MAKRKTPFSTEHPWKKAREKISLAMRAQRVPFPSQGSSARAVTPPPQQQERKGGKAYHFRVSVSLSDFARKQERK